MNCKDCLHYEICPYHIDEETDMTVKECLHGFKNKSDYVEVVHSEWIKQDCYDTRDTWVKCSNCGYAATALMINDCSFCPCCGAKMDGGKNND